MAGKTPIILGISSSSPLPGKSESNALAPDMKQKIFERDDHTCRCCGFQSQKYQDIHIVNGMASDMRPENLVTTCIFCHQCFNLDKVAQMRSGILIWLPEIEQTQLHNIARAIYVARISQGPMAEAAKHSLDTLMKRRKAAEERLGTDEPQILAAVLKDYISSKTYERRTEKLDGIRLFPLDRRIIKEADLEFNQFPQILAYWRSKNGPFGGLVPKKWVDLYKDTVLRVAA